ncbi:biotin/lipoyl-binding protein, partial [Xanthomonas perforans]
MPHAPDRMVHFPTLAAMRPPSIAKAVAWMLLIGIGIAAAILALAPWVQTASGKGQVVSLDPSDRQQPVTAFVPGRVERWYVHDGQHVSKGDPIARVGDL